MVVSFLFARNNECGAANIVMSDSVPTAPSAVVTSVSVSLMSKLTTDPDTFNFFFFAACLVSVVAAVLTGMSNYLEDNFLY